MSEEFGGDFVSISDEEGNNYELEHLDTIELNGEIYVAFLPADMDEDSEDYGMVILKSETGEDGEEYFVNPTEEETEAAYAAFMERLFDEEEEDK